MKLFFSIHRWLDSLPNGKRSIVVALCIIAMFVLPFAMGSLFNSVFAAQLTSLVFVIIMIGMLFSAIILYGRQE